MVKYSETTGGYFYKIIKNNKKIISKKEYMKKNLKGGIGSSNNMGGTGINNNINFNNNCFIDDFKDNNWIVLVHGTMTGDEFKLPDNIQLYNYASLGDPYRIYLPPDNDLNNNRDYTYDINKK
jgi:hypothetical protein